LQLFPFKRNTKKFSSKDDSAFEEMASSCRGVFVSQLNVRVDRNLTFNFRDIADTGKDLRRFINHGVYILFFFLIIKSDMRSLDRSYDGEAAHPHIVLFENVLNGQKQISVVLKPFKEHLVQFIKPHNVVGK